MDQHVLPWCVALCVSFSYVIRPLETRIWEIAHSHVPLSILSPPWRRHSECWALSALFLNLSSIMNHYFSGLLVPATSIDWTRMSFVWKFLECFKSSVSFPFSPYLAWLPHGLVLENVGLVQVKHKTHQLISKRRDLILQYFYDVLFSDAND